MMKLDAALSVLVATTLLVIAAMQSAAASGSSMYLMNGYYNAKGCGGVETVVKQEVYKALDYDRSKGAALVRLFFHDCWVHVSKRFTN